MDCDMCGRIGVNTKKVLVEGTQMNVCPNCAQFGKEVTQPRRPKPRDRINPDEQRIVVDDYAARIKSGREAKGMKQAELAKELHEKESLIHAVESGHTRPSFKLARKFERFLRIKLIEEMEAVQGVVEQHVEGEALTMEEKVRAALKKK